MKTVRPRIQQWGEQWLQVLEGLLYAYCIYVNVYVAYYINLYIYIYANV